MLISISITFAPTMAAAAAVVVLFQVESIEVDLGLTQLGTHYYHYY